MAASPKHGNHSWKSSAQNSRVIRDLPAACELLKQRSDSSFIRSLAEALGPQAQLHLVGGFVRDAFLLEASAQDVDLCTRFSATEVKAKLLEKNFRVVDTGIEHGTVTIVHDEETCEITTFRDPSPRSASQYSDNIETDLSGRDFTINAMAFHLESQSFVDPFHGHADLQNNILRAVGDAQARFTEDPLRILRAMRFGPAEGRILEEHTYSAATLLVPELAQVSIERIREEFLHILLAPSARAGMYALQELEIFPIFLPEILPCIGCEQNDFHVEDVFEHTLTVLERAPRDALLRLTALFHDIGKPASLSVDAGGRRHFYKHEIISEDVSKRVMERMKFSNHLTKDVSRLVREHMRPLDCGPSGARRLIRDLDALLPKWLLFKQADAPPTMPEKEFRGMFDAFLALVAQEEKRTREKNLRKLAVNGNDLQALGCAPGPGMGKILKSLEEKIMEDPDLNTRERLLPIAEKLFNQDGQS